MSNMKRLSKTITLVLILVLVLSIFSVLPFTQDESAENTVYANSGDLNGDGYDDGDVSAFIDLCSKYAIDIDKTSPAAWENKKSDVTRNASVYWSDGNSVKKIVEIKLVEFSSKLTGTTLNFENFSELKILYCANNKLKALDVSQNNALTELHCNDNQLTTIDVSQNNALVALFCNNNQLTSIDVSNNNTLTALCCNNNQLATIDVSRNNALTTLSLDDNQLTSIDVSNNNTLTALYCNNNQLATIDVSKNNALTALYCNNNQLATIDFSKNNALTTLSLGGNQLTSIDVSKNNALTALYCNNNPLSTIDVSKNSVLTELYCFKNKLTTLNVSKNNALTTLYCNNNQLTALDVSENSSLTKLYCGSNPLSKLLLRGGKGIDATGKYGNGLIEIHDNVLDDNTAVSVKAVSGIKGFAFIRWAGNSGITDTTDMITLAGLKTKKYTVTPIFKGSMAGAKLNLSSTSYSYTGNKITPSVTATLDRYTLNPSDYSISYSNNTNPGKATVTIIGKNDLSGNANATFTITAPKIKTTKISKLTSKNKALKVKWKKVNGTTKYQIRYKQEGKKKWTTKTVSAKKNTYTIKKLKAKKKYQVQVMSYKTIGGMNYYSKWSAKKTKITK